MKKSILISIFALLFSVASFAQQAEQKPAERKAPTVEEIAKRRADMMRQQYLLGKDQYDKVYKLCLKQAKKDMARMEEIKKEREQMNNEMKGILNDAQWERYEKMQKFNRFNHGKNFRRPGKPGQPMTAPYKGKNTQIKKGPQIERPQGKRTNMFIEKKATDEKKAE